MQLPHTHTYTSGNVQCMCHSQKEEVWIDQNIICRINFRRWIAADDISKSSSHLPWDLVMRWSWNWGCCHLLSFAFGINIHFVFGFVVFHLWVYSDIRWQTTHTGSFRIPCLGLCPVSTDLKLSLSSLARYTISGQFHRRPNHLFQIRVRFDFKYYLIILWKNMQMLFTNRALLTVRHMDQIWGGEGREVLP